MALDPNFWQHKSLEQMNDEEWEALCDGCGKCCLHKFIDDAETDDMQTTEVIHQDEQLAYTDIVCQYINDKTCVCTCYSKRQKLVPDCVKLTKDNLKDVFYMPPSCTYRRLQEGKDIPSWHPLLNKGKKTAMHKAGMSIRGKTIKDNQIDMEDFEDRIVTWPLKELD
ncbi:YcgN family cysteine cluster protein [Saccharobesus litoralis]|uniref:YcgN family cysteine cluster protein n=1 Tax=Saccharobesus litoralis TaxID=2172099 RepID=A0A2S0VUM7_9ALTE|nr:YcgN family cysteine cluster protein [Saccharobesus litoralis]AWB67927.1 YcgN family cysteine cluster protein [Saccharobesus litoralis]